MNFLCKKPNSRIIFLEAVFFVIVTAVVSLLPVSEVLAYPYTSPTSYATGDVANSVKAADLDGDGDQDLAVTNYGSSSTSVLLNNGSGIFAAAVNYIVGQGPYDVDAVDVDGDGDLDLVTANNVSSTVSILLNNGSGTFVIAAAYYDVGKGAHDIYAADLDGDGDPDLTTTNNTSSTVSVLLNNGSGTFAAAVNYGTPTGTLDVFAADLDGDGDNDLATTDAPGFGIAFGFVSVLLNNGNGTFAAAVNYNAGGYPANLRVADLDGDGDKDMAAANYGSSTVSVFLNNGNGTFAVAVNYVAGNGSYGLDAADLDRDGDIDLATANFNVSTVSVLLNNGNGTFASALSYNTGANPSSIIAIDLDGDNDKELVTANNTSDNISVLFSLLARVPTLTSISPTTKAQNGSAFTLTVTGTDFTASSTVRFNGLARTTTYVTTTQLTAEILASDLTMVTGYFVRVFTPTPGGGESNAQVFVVTQASGGGGGGGGLGAPEVNALPPSTPTFQTNLDNLKNIGVAVHSLIKLPCATVAASLDPNNVCKAVYYTGADGKRHAFPNDKVYFTWYTSFDGVQLISDAQLASIPLGANVTYKPGKKMVKFTTDAKVYAVAKGGILRWVTTEAAATELYGSMWNMKIDDISDAFFANYSFGANVTGLADFNPAQVEASVTFPSDSLQM